MGEGAPIVRYRENAEDGKKAIGAITPFLQTANPWRSERLMAEVSRQMPNQFAAQAALDIAVMDWVGKKLNAPLYELLGLDPADTPITTFSIGIDTPENTRQKVQEAEPFPILKIKVGLTTDEETITAVRSVTKKPLRVDTNEGWTNKEEAVRKINWLESQGAGVRRTTDARRDDRRDALGARPCAPADYGRRGRRQCSRDPETGGRLRWRECQSAAVSGKPFA